MFSSIRPSARSYPRLSAGVTFSIACVLALAGCTVTRLPPPAGTPVDGSAAPASVGGASPSVGTPVGTPVATATPVPSSTVSNLPPMNAGTAAAAVAPGAAGQLLQAGIFSNASYAQTLAQKLQAVDGLSGLVRVQSDAGGMHRVLAGPFANEVARQAASQAIQRVTGSAPFTYRGASN